MSKTQQEALYAAREHGALERRPGGFWTWPGCTETRPGVPKWSASTPTIHAMIRAGLLVVSGYNVNRNGTFATRVVAPNSNDHE